MQVFSTIFRFDFISSPSDFTFEQVRSVLIVIDFSIPSFLSSIFILYFSPSLSLNGRLRQCISPGLCLKSFGKYKGFLFTTFSVTVLPVIYDSVRTSNLLL